MDSIKYRDTSLSVKVANYVNDPVCLAVQCYDEEDHQLYSVPTVNLGSNIGNHTIMPPYCAFMDTNNSAGLVKAFEEQGLISPYTRFGEQVKMQSGYCEYPLYQFDANKLKELDPEGCVEYKNKYQKAFSRIQSRMVDASMTGNQISVSEACELADGPEINE